MLLLAPFLSCAVLRRQGKTSRIGYDDDDDDDDDDDVKNRESHCWLTGKLAMVMQAINTM